MTASPDAGGAGAGPLADVTVLELGGLGAVPFAGMMLADLGAKVIVFDRPGAEVEVPLDLLRRNKIALTVDLKSEAGRDLALAMFARVDVVLEGFRPGVVDRLGVGPAAALGANPRVVYGHMTGYGQTGPLAQVPGHDINFISQAGVLRHIGVPELPPVLPINLVGDYAGGGMLLAVGALAALASARTTGEGDIVDVAMIDGAALLMTAFYGLTATGHWSADRGTNEYDGGAPQVNVYETSDGEFVAFGAVEPKFYAALVETLDLPASRMFPQEDRSQWSHRRALVAEVVATRTRQEWCEVFDGVEACFSPVLSMSEAAAHPHAAARGAFAEVDSVWQPTPAPRFVKKPLAELTSTHAKSLNLISVLESMGFEEEDARSWQRRLGYQ